jgi:YVTN family beta-propeller protein
MGNVPRGIVFNPQSNRVYVSNYSSDNVSVIDGIKDSVIATIVVGDGPTAIFHNPAGNKIYCSNVGAPGPDSPDECTVSIIDAATNKVIKTLTTGDEPTSFCYASNSKRVYWANEWSHDIAVMDAVSDTFIAVVKYPSPPITPVDVCYNPQNNRIYTANRMKFAIGIIKDTFSVTSSVLYFPGEEPLVFFPNPVTDMLYLKEVSAYTIYSTAGSLLLQSEKKEKQIDVVALPAGVYFLKTDKGNVRFLKE